MALEQVGMPSQRLTEVRQSIKELETETEIRFKELERSIKELEAKTSVGLKELEIKLKNMECQLIDRIHKWSIIVVIAIQTAIMLTAFKFFH
jgi:hypothetical protein